MNKDIYELHKHCNSLHVPNITNEKTECNPVSISALFEQFNIHGNGHLLE